MKHTLAAIERLRGWAKDDIAEADKLSMHSNNDSGDAVDVCAALKIAIEALSLVDASCTCGTCHIKIAKDALDKIEAIFSEEK